MGIAATIVYCVLFFFITSNLLRMWNDARYAYDCEAAGGYAVRVIGKGRACIAGPVIKLVKVNKRSH